MNGLVNLDERDRVALVAASAAAAIFAAMCVVSLLGIGNPIYDFLTSGGVFDDYTGLFRFAPTLPNPEIAIQYTAPAILLGRFFKEPTVLVFLLFMLSGVIAPIFLIARALAGFFKVNPYIYLFLVFTSYPVVFGVSRGNPTIAGVFWSIAAMLYFSNNKVTHTGLSIFIGSLFHPMAAYFSIIFLLKGIRPSIIWPSVILAFHLICYQLIDGNLFKTLANVTMSLKVYSDDYIIGGGGDLYNNSLYFLFKYIFYSNMEIVETILRFITIALLGLFLLKLIWVCKQNGKRIAAFTFSFVLVPLFLVVSSPVSADYRLAYLLIPIILSLTSGTYGWLLIVLLLVTVPKHIVFFSDYWLQTHPDALLVFPVHMETVGVTSNSLINPILLLLALLVPGSELERIAGIAKGKTSRLVDLCPF